MTRTLAILAIALAACASPAPSAKPTPKPAPDAAPIAAPAPDAAPIAVPAPDAAPIAVAAPDAAPRPTTCAADADHCCERDGEIVEVHCSPRPKDGHQVQRTRGEGGWCAGCYKKCLPASAQIDTPLGAVAVSSLRVGDLVWTRDAAGARVAAPILAVRSIPAPRDHALVRVTLADGRVVAGSAGHPTADGGWLGGLVVGGTLDGAAIVAIDEAALGGDATWDVLPDGATGVYWADGVLLGSTLSAP